MNETRTTIDKVQTAIQWAEKYVAEFDRNNPFDPYDMMINPQKYTLYEKCNAFLMTVERMTEKFMNSRICGARVEPINTSFSWDDIDSLEGACLGDTID